MRATPRTRKPPLVKKIQDGDVDNLKLHLGMGTGRGCAEMDVAMFGMSLIYRSIEILDDFHESDPEPNAKKEKVGLGWFTFEHKINNGFTCCAWSCWLLERLGLLQRGTPSTWTSCTRAMWLSCRCCCFRLGKWKMQQDNLTHIWEDEPSKPLYTGWQWWQKHQFSCKKKCWFASNSFLSWKTPPLRLNLLDPIRLSFSQYISSRFCLICIPQFWFISWLGSDVCETETARTLPLSSTTVSLVSDLVLTNQRIVAVPPKNGIVSTLGLTRLID